jgi:hypothetical protein
MNPTTNSFLRQLLQQRGRPESRAPSFHLGFGLSYSREGHAIQQIAKALFEALEVRLLRDADKADWPFRAQTLGIREIRILSWQISREFASASPQERWTGRPLRRSIQFSTVDPSQRCAMKCLVSIPSRFVDQLKGTKETGIGYQVVSVELKDGRSFDQVVTSEGCIIEVRGYTEIPFAADDVASVSLNHKHWNFRDGSDTRSKSRSATA